MTKHTTLSHRGRDLADGPSGRDKFREILGDPYEPDLNPDGFINIGVAENVCLKPFGISIHLRAGAKGRPLQYAMLADVQKYVNENVISIFR